MSQAHPFWRSGSHASALPLVLLALGLAFLPALQPLAAERGAVCAEGDGKSGEMTFGMFIAQSAANLWIRGANRARCLLSELGPGCIVIEFSCIAFGAAVRQLADVHDVIVSERVTDFLEVVVAVAGGAPVATRSGCRIAEARPSRRGGR